MAPSADRSKEVLDRLLEQAAVERDRSKFLELLRQINRLRAERWLRSSSPVPAPPRPAAESERFDLFAGQPDRDAEWIEAVVGRDQARLRMGEIAAREPGQYFVRHSRTRSIIERIDTRAVHASDSQSVPDEDAA